MPATPAHTVSPLVLSASRATDVPACRLAWFLEALRAGGCAWRNPFNGAQTWVSFAAARVIVFWRDLYELLEKAIDRCRDAGTAAFITVLKNS